MRWDLEHGVTYRKALKAGEDLPEPLPPEMPMGLNGWYADFQELSTDRQFGMGVGPVPAASIARHTEGWPHDEAWAFRVCVREMDAAYLERANRPREDGEAGAAPASPSAIHPAEAALARRG